MTNETIFKEIEKEENEKQEAQEKERVRKMMKDILEKMQVQKNKKQEAEEALRILKLDLDDLRAGKIEKIRERHASERATQLVPYVNNTWNNFQQLFPEDWWDFTSGTYTVCTNGDCKTYYF